MGDILQGCWCVTGNRGGARHERTSHFAFLLILLNHPTQATAGKRNIFASLDRRQRVSRTTEITTYMREEPIKADYAKDPLKYWYEKTGDRFARMALDFMSAPGKLNLSSSAIILIQSSATSVDVERAFSRGSLTVSKHRHSLSDQSTRAAIILSSWVQVPGVVVEMDVIEVLEEKCRRPKSRRHNRGG